MGILFHMFYIHDLVSRTHSKSKMYIDIHRIMWVKELAGKTNEIDKTLKNAIHMTR